MFRPRAGHRRSRVESEWSRRWGGRASASAEQPRLVPLAPPSKPRGRSTLSFVCAHPRRRHPFRRSLHPFPLQPAEGGLKRPSGSRNYVQDQSPIGELEATRSSFRPEPTCQPRREFENPEAPNPAADRHGKRRRLDAPTPLAGEHARLRKGRNTRRRGNLGDWSPGKAR